MARVKGKGSRREEAKAASSSPRERPYRGEAERGAVLIEASFLALPVTLVFAAYIIGAYLVLYTSASIHTAGIGLIAAMSIPQSESSSITRGELLTFEALSAPAPLRIAGRAHRNPHAGALIEANHFYDFGDVWLRHIANSIGGIVRKSFPLVNFMSDPSSPVERSTVQVESRRLTNAAGTELVAVDVRWRTPLVQSISPHARAYFPNDSRPRRGSPPPISDVTALILAATS